MGMWNDERAWGDAPANGVSLLASVAIENNNIGFWWKRIELNIVSNFSDIRSAGSIG